MGGFGRRLVWPSNDAHQTVRMGKGFERFLLDSLSHAIVHRAIRSVLVIR